MPGADYYHCRLKQFSRSAGKAIVNCAAYRAGMALEDERYGMVRDFSRKGDVVTSFTLAPEGAPAWASDITRLWNEVERKENRKNSQLAFEWEVALPNELTDAQRESLARSFAGWLVDEYGVAVTTGIHNGGDRGNGLNDHMHVLMTSREITPEGWSKNKFREFSTQPGVKNPEVDKVREHVADLINEALEEAGSEDRVDHRSFKQRGIAREPTRHLGPAATAYERQGFESDRGNINREILEARIAWMQDEAQPEITAKLEHEFAARWGDAPAPEGRDAALSPEPEAEPAKRAAAPQAEKPPGEAKRVTPWGTQWRAFSDRARSFGAGLHDLWASEDSGGTATRGIAARLVDAGRKLAHGYGHRQGSELVEGIHDAAAIARDLVHDEAGGSPPKETEAPGKPRSWVQRVMDEAAHLFHTERGSTPAEGFTDAATEFDRKAADWMKDTTPEAHAPPAPDYPSQSEPPKPEPKGWDIER